MTESRSIMVSCCTVAASFSACKTCRKLGVGTASGVPPPSTATKPGTSQCKTRSATVQESVLAKKVVNGTMHLLSCRPCAMKGFDPTRLVTMQPLVLVRKAVNGSICLLCCKPCATRGPGLTQSSTVQASALVSEDVITEGSYLVRMAVTIVEDRPEVAWYSYSAMVSIGSWCWSF